MSQDDLEQKRLKRFLERRHPEYEDKKEHWEFLESSYAGGRGWFEANIFRYYKEGNSEFEGRKKRAYRFNHTKEVVDLVDKHLFKQEIARSEDAPESVKKFWRLSTMNHLSIREFAHRISNRSSTFGRIWVVVDSSYLNPEGVMSIADEKSEKFRTYAYIVTPKSVLDMSLDDFGDLNWILIHEQVRDDENPIDSSGDVIDRYRLWTKEDWTLFTVKREGRKSTVFKEGPFPHSLGEVPVIPADCFISDEEYTSSGLIDDVAYMDRAATNYMSCTDTIIHDQTFSQLAIPAQAIAPEDKDETKEAITTMGTKRIFTYDGEGGGKPFYLSPDVKQAELIMTVVNKIIAQIYHTVGLAGERTKDDNSQGIDNSSGVAKAYDFERVNSLLAAKADSLEVVENKIARLVAKWNGEEVDPEAKLVSYPDNFDVRGLYDEFEISARLSLIEAPDLVRREQMESMIDKLFPNIKKDLREKMTKELEEWPVHEVVEPGAVSGKGAIAKEGKNSLANSLVKGKK